ncbi:MAG: PHP domain-containing protein [Planctomycetota bacterium]
MLKELERKLDSFDAAERKQALNLLFEKVDAGEITLPQAGTAVNLHCHTFFSYNTYGYSPSKFAWLARKAGLAVAEVVDFDVLDALEEFLTAARKLGLKACAGLETRVFVPEFSTRVINSLGEPGISYHMGVGFPKAALEGQPGKFLLDLRKTAQQRNRDLMVRVNSYLQPVELDYERDVLAMTPSGNATERHVCLAYARKAKEVFNDNSAFSQFWAEKLGPEAKSLKLPESMDLLNMIRAKTMKCGGAGYVVPDKGSFPLMADFNQFILAAGGIPTMTWLNGLSEGEQSLEELVEVAVSTGTAAINIIPHRNYTPSVKDQKLVNLYQVVELAEKLHLPVVVGTEMNSPGQKFVDDFDSQELSPLSGVFLKGACIVYAHSVLQQRAGLGYNSNWAKKNFEDPAEKNEFFKNLGSSLQPVQEDILGGLSDDISAREILAKVSN